MYEYPLLCVNSIYECDRLYYNRNLREIFLTIFSISGFSAICCSTPRGPGLWPCRDPCLDACRDAPRDIALDGGGINLPVVSEYCVLGLSGSDLGAAGCCGWYSLRASVNAFNSSLHASVTGTVKRKKFVATTTIYITKTSP